MNDIVDVILYEQVAEAGSLKARAAATAAYEPSAGTCRGVYCHSSGQATPTYVTTPAWNSVNKLACGDCHGNPPAYPSGGAGTVTANSHIGLASDGHEWGHFLGLPGPWMTSKHGGNSSPTQDSAPITCQTCHYETTDPANTGPSGFYYLDTTGTYALPGGDPSRTSWQAGDPSGISWQARQQCGYCHDPDAVGIGKVLPLRHVNGTRDVRFDPRDTHQKISWRPDAAYVYPYWMTGARSEEWPPTVSRNGSTVSFSLKNVTYDPQTKTCSNTACHLADRRPVWGRPLIVGRSDACLVCHASK
jgi:predicted CxxxxCH...CXXCH cytochrome family protein